jgi:hypothetical protein
MPTPCQWWMVSKVFLPFHIAANWNASLDIIFYLLQHCPDALRHVSGGNNDTAVAQCFDYYPASV